MLQEEHAAFLPDGVGVCKLSGQNNNCCTGNNGPVSSSGADKNTEVPGSKNHVMDMERTQFSWNGFYAMPVIGIMRNISAADVADILPLYYDSGLTTIEVTMNSPGFEESIRLALQNFAGKVNIGAGTVRTEKDLESALHAGAQFIVTPVIDLKVIELCKQSGIPLFAGAYTRTEIVTE